MQQTEHSETPETATTDNAPETAQPETTASDPGEKPVSLAQALLGEAEPGETPEKGEAAKGEDDSPKGLHALAERLGMEAQDLYAVEVPMADGTGVKLGELKDLYAQQEDVTRRELEIEDRRTKLDAEIARVRSELETLMASLPQDAVKPEALDRLRQEALARRDRERTATLEAIPEWADEKVRTDELKGMVGLLTDYGFEARYLDQNLDHRMVRLTRDFYRLKALHQRALSKVKKVEPTSTGRSRRAPPKETRQASKFGSRAGNLRALLNEG